MPSNFDADLALARLDAVARASDVVRCSVRYVRCMREFTDTAAGNLSNCCSEHYDALDGAVEAYNAAEERVLALMMEPAYPRPAEVESGS